MAYVVGLIATDGCLSSDGRHITFTSQDRQLADAFCDSLGRSRRYRVPTSARGTPVYYVHLGDVAFYRWLISIGLTPRKSLTLREIDVPDAHLLPLTRGLLDGDGSVYTLVHHPTTRADPGYSYERLWVYFTSGSRPHLEWLAGALERVLGIAGYVESRAPRGGRHAFYRLKYGNRASTLLLPALYADWRAPRLERKWSKWHAYAARHGLL
jgi:hypothetical protein